MLNLMEIAPPMSLNRIFDFSGFLSTLSNRSAEIYFKNSFQFLKNEKQFQISLFTSPFYGGEMMNSSKRLNVCARTHPAPVGESRLEITDLMTEIYSCPR